MKHLMTILEFEHLDQDGKVLYREENIPNTFHVVGELYCLTGLFNNNGSVIPSNYYLGLDNRTAVVTTDTINSLVDEPTVNGYFRQSVSSVNGWTIESIGGVYRATSNIVSFTASGGSWGPVQNIFLTTKSDNTGYLIATSSLSSSVTPTSGTVTQLRFALSLRDYPI
jgi:hypothetical protein